MRDAPDGYPELKWDELGLLPATVQDTDGAVLLLGWMNRQCYERTRETGALWLWSRSRATFWMHGPDHEPRLDVLSIEANCMADSLLVRVDAHELGVCHSGNRTCFFRSAETAEPAADEAEHKPRMRLGEGLRDGMRVDDLIEDLRRRLYPASTAVIEIRDRHGSFARAGVTDIVRGYSPFVDQGMGPAEVYLIGTAEECGCARAATGDMVGHLPVCTNTAELESLRRRIYVLESFYKAGRRDQPELPPVERLTALLDEGVRAELDSLRAQLAQAHAHARQLELERGITYKGRKDS